MKAIKIIVRCGYVALIVALFCLLGGIFSPRPKDYSRIKHTINLLVEGQEIDSGSREAVYEFLKRRFSGERGEALGLDFSDVIRKIQSGQRLNTVDKQQLSTMLKMCSERSKR
jgi:hypothetical protein